MDFQGQDLTGTKHEGHDLKGALLRGARLIRADLTGADLREADLRGADLSFARLLGADLRGVQVDAATSFYAAKLLGAKVDPETLALARVAGAALPDAQVAEPMVLPPTSECVDIDVSPDRSLLASAHEDDTIVLWQMVTGQPFRILSVPNGNITSVSFSPDGTSLIATSSTSGSVWGWKVATGQLIGVLEGVTTSAISPDGTLLAAGIQNRTVVLWDPTTGKVRRILPGHQNIVQKIAFSYDGHVLASGSEDGTVRLWSVADGALRYTLKEHFGGVDDLLFSADGHTLGTVEHQGRRVRLWHMASGTLLNTLIEVVQGCATSTNGLIACAARDKNVYVWDMATGSRRYSLAGHAGDAVRLAFSSDSRTLATGGRDATVRLWNMVTGALLQTLREPAGAVARMGFSSDGNTFIAMAHHGAPHLWDVATGRQRPSTPGGPSGGILSADLRVFLRAAGKQMGLWDVWSGALLHRLPQTAAAVTGVAFAPDSKLMAISVWSEGMSLWDPTAGAFIGSIPEVPRTSVRIAFGANKSILSGGMEDGSALIWDVSTRKLLGGFDAQGRSVLKPGSWEAAAFSDTANKPFREGRSNLPRWRPIYDGRVAFSPNQRVAQATTQGTIRLWNAVTGELIDSLGGRGKIQDMAFSANGRLLAACFRKNNIVLWDVTTGKRVHKFNAREGDAVCRLAFSGDGRLLASADNDTIHLWELATGKLQRRIELRIQSGDDKAFEASRSKVFSSYLFTEEALNRSRTPGGSAVVLPSDNPGITAITFHPQVPLLAVGFGDKVVSLWDAATGTQLRSISGHLGAITSLTFNPDGNILASGSRDGTVRLWAPTTGEALATLARFEDGWAVFTPDGRYQAAGKSTGQFWYTIGLCQFEPDELASYFPSIRRVAEGTPLLAPFFPTKPVGRDSQVPQAR